MPKKPGIGHSRAVKALQKAGFEVVREGKKHIVMPDGLRFVTIPRSNLVNAYTMGGIAKDAGLAPEAFKNSCSPWTTWQRSYSRFAFMSGLSAVCGETAESPPGGRVWGGRRLGLFGIGAGLDGVQGVAFTSLVTLTTRFCLAPTSSSPSTMSTDRSARFTSRSSGTEAPGLSSRIYTKPSSKAVSTGR